VPVRIEGSRQRAVLAGDNSDRPRLAFLPATVKVRPGDRLVTSGDGGLFPSGLPVGVVDAVGLDGIRVRTWSALEALEFIRVVRYDARPLSLDGIEDENGPAQRRIAPKPPVEAQPGAPTTIPIGVVPPETAVEPALPASVPAVNAATPASLGAVAPQAQPAGSTMTTTGGDPADGSLDPEVIDRPE
jgi:rod shape-determining protein MreC